MHNLRCTYIQQKGPTIHENAKFVKFLGIFRNDGKINPDIVYVYIFLNRAQILPRIAITAKSDGDIVNLTRVQILYVNLTLGVNRGKGKCIFTRV
jgi:hypothetical protein